MTPDQREHQRIFSLNLLNVTLIDSEKNIVLQGMGRTINVSMGGILMETHFLVDSKNLIDLSIGFEDDIINLKGSVVYCKKMSDDNTYQSGIKFLQLSDSTLSILKRYIFAFKAAKFNE